MPPHKIVVIGAGVTGLTTAVLLSENSDYQITILAKHLPGDYDIEYASPWAGANFWPFSAPGSRENRYERNTWPELSRLAKSCPEAGIHFQDVRLYTRMEEAEGLNIDGPQKYQHSRSPWFAELLPDFRLINDVSALPSGISYATAFTSVCINPTIYLPYLLSQCLSRNVVVRRSTVDHIADAARSHHSGQQADLVVNCTGLMASRLGGVQDSTVVPVRGQTVLVQSDPGMPGVMASVSGNDDGADELMYVMDRPAGGGTILGGSYQYNNWTAEPELALSERIIRRCLTHCPQLLPKDTTGSSPSGLKIIRHNVGLRPFRRDGVRIEHEKIADVDVVHNYGHGGYGYQTSYGCAREAVEVLEKLLEGKIGKD